MNLAFPQGLALDQHGDLFISDSGHQQVLALTPGPTAAAAGRCGYDAAVRYVEQHHLGNAGFTDFPVAQAFCGPFAGRHSKAMVVSIGIPSCGLSSGWLVLRRSGNHWQRVLKVRHGAFLTRSGARINEWQGVLAAGDAHCLPSSARMRTWHWNGKHLVHGRWHHRAKLPKHLPGTAPLDG